MKPIEPIAEKSLRKTFLGIPMHIWLTIFYGQREF